MQTKQPLRGRGTAVSEEMLARLPVTLAKSQILNRAPQQPGARINSPISVMLGLALKECQAYAALGGFAQSFSARASREAQWGVSRSISSRCTNQSVRIHTHLSRSSMIYLPSGLNVINFASDSNTLLLIHSAAGEAVSPMFAYFR